MLSTALMHLTPHTVQLGPDFPGSRDRSRTDLESADHLYGNHAFDTAIR
jgi:hypothetical protein